MRKLLFFFGFTLVICGLVGAVHATAISVPSHRSAGEFDRAAYRAEQQQLLSWLVSEQVEEGLVVPVSINLTEHELRVIEAGREAGSQSSPSALLIGIVKPAALSFDLAAPSHGAVARTDDGGLVWSAAIHSDRAAALRVHFESFSLPPGFELWIYSMDGIVRGPYTGRGPHDSGEFWSQTVSGPDAILQLRGFGAAAAEQVASFAVTDVGHMGDRAALKSFCDFNADCIENVNCTSNPAVNDARNAVALMRYVKRPYIYLCSGGLLNDSASTGTPYFLTANHCISRDREAGTLEAWFGYDVNCGTHSCTEPFFDLTGPSTLGASVLATNKSSDFTLLLLDEPPPAGSAFLGWSTTEIANSDGAPLYRVSHPSGAPQAYSEHQVSTSAGTCTSWPRGPWIYSKDVVGATEGGSSGSPVVNALGEVVGQLSGGCGTNVNVTCDNINNATVDGAFAEYYSQVAPWLGGGAGCDDADNDGYDDEACGGNDCDDSDPNINPGAEEVCDNFVDDDCNGLIDAADPACGGGSCLPKGDPCTTGSECCSGLCHPRKLVCK